MAVTPVRPGHSEQSRSMAVILVVHASKPASQVIINACVRILPLIILLVGALRTTIFKRVIATAFLGRSQLNTSMRDPQESVKNVQRDAPVVSMGASSVAASPSDKFSTVFQSKDTVCVYKPHLKLTGGARTASITCHTMLTDSAKLVGIVQAAQELENAFPAHSTWNCLRVSASVHLSQATRWSISMESVAAH